MCVWYTTVYTFAIVNCLSYFRQYVQNIIILSCAMTDVVIPVIHSQKAPSPSLSRELTLKAYDHFIPSDVEKISIPADFTHRLFSETFFDTHDHLLLKNNTWLRLQILEKESHKESWTLEYQVYSSRALIPCILSQFHLLLSNFTDQHSQR